MNADEFRKLDIEELNQRIDSLRADLFNLRVQNTTKELQDTSQLRQVRRDLARALTILNQKRRDEGQPAGV